MSKARKSGPKPQTFSDCVRQFLTPQVWKQAQRHGPRPHGSTRWALGPVTWTLLVMTWCTGDSLVERFETARAFYVAGHQRSRRPGKTLAGFEKALAKLPLPMLRALACGVRQRIQQLFAARLVVQGFIPLGCDGSRLECPRTAELEKRLGQAGNTDSAPTLWLTAFVHLGTGMLWSWRLGKGTASELEHLRHLLATLPRLALVVADAAYVGYDLLLAILGAQASFLIRMSSRVYLYTTEQLPLDRFEEGMVYYWPIRMQRAGKPPIPARLLCLRGQKADVWLLTNVLDHAQLSRQTAAQFYRWRWRNEGLFRTYKQTLGKVKLMGRTVRQVHREAEASLLALQLLLAQGALALTQGQDSVVLTLSPRQILLEMRQEIQVQVGSYLGPRQRQSYFLRLARAQTCSRRSRKVRRAWPRRKDHVPPKPPTILTMTREQKTLMTKVLQCA